MAAAVLEDFLTADVAQWAQGKDIFTVRRESLKLASRQFISQQETEAAAAVCNPHKHTRVFSGTIKSICMGHNKWEKSVAKSSSAFR